MVRVVWGRASPAGVTPRCDLGEGMYPRWRDEDRPDRTTSPQERTPANAHPGSTGSMVSPKAPPCGGLETGRRGRWASRQTFPEALQEHGISPGNGLRMVMTNGSGGFAQAHTLSLWRVSHQRCVFHKLQNIQQALDFSAYPDPDSRRQGVRTLLRQPGAIWKAPTKTEAYLRYKTFCAQWVQDQPEAVATLRRDFDDTLTFYDVRDKVQREQESLGQRLVYAPPARWSERSANCAVASLRPSCSSPNRAFVLLQPSASAQDQDFPENKDTVSRWKPCAPGQGQGERAVSLSVGQLLTPGLDNSLGVLCVGTTHDGRWIIS